jgi:hypothetical protein
MKDDLQVQLNLNSTMSTSGTVMSRAAAHLNDVNQLSYTSTVLLPFLNAALDELGEELSVYDLSPIWKDSIIIDVPAESLVIPQMPVGFFEAINLIERSEGSELWSPSIREVAFIDDNLTTAEGIVQWTVRGSQIFINPPQTDREVILDYVGGLTEATGDATAVDIEASRNFLSLVTARNAATDLGNAPTKGQMFESRIIRSRDRLIRRLLKNTQHTLGVRRRPYTGRNV